MKKIVVPLACLLVAGMASASRGRNRPASKLVGKWRSTLSKDRVLEFKPDGTLAGTPYGQGQPAVAGKFEVEGENRVKMTVPDAEGFSESSMWQFEFTEDGKKMRIRSEKGSVVPVTFERVE